MSTVPNNPLKPFAWFDAAAGSSHKSGLGGAFVKFAVCLVVGLLFWAAHHPTLAIVVTAIGLALFAVSAASPAAMSAIDSLLAKFGRIVGTIVGGILLTLLYLLIFTPARIFRRISGVDELHLRDGNRASFWLPCDDERRKARHVGAMFATEVPVRRGRPLVTMCVVLIGMFVLSEGLLRVMHYGEPITYVADPLIGYYPTPNMTELRSGGLIHINQYGMRSDDVTATKPPNTFRILMLGDSTLYGGSYIDQKDLYSDRLKVHLNARVAPRKVEILAMGVNGWGPFHERGYVKHFGTFDADLAIVCLPIDDVNRPMYGLMEVPFFAKQTPPHLALEEVMNHFIWRYRAEHSGKDDAWEAQQSQLGIAEYGRLVDDLKQHGCEVMVVVHPSRSPGFGGDETPDELKWRMQLTDTVAQRGVKTYFAKGWFKDKGTPDEIYTDNMHLLAPGHHAYANFLEDRIVADSATFHAFTSKGAP